MEKKKAIGRRPPWVWIVAVAACAVATCQAESVTVPAGTLVTVRMTESIDSERNHVGETFRATVDSPVRVDGKLAIPRGAEAIGRLVAVEQAGRIQGSSKVAVELTAVNFDGQSVAVSTSAYQEVGSSQGKDTAKMAGGGGVLGAIVGAIAGGKKGALIGAGVGAAGGAVVETIRGSEHIQIPAEALVIFTLQSPVTVETATP